MRCYMIALAWDTGPGGGHCSEENTSRVRTQTVTCEQGLGDMKEPPMQTGEGRLCQQGSGALERERMVPLRNNRSGQSQGEGRETSGTSQALAIVWISSQLKGRGMGARHRVEGELKKRKLRILRRAHTHPRSSPQHP